MQKVLNLVKAVYNNITVYRIIWTSIQALAGVLAAELTGNVLVGGAVLLVTTWLTSVAREKLAARGE